MTYYPDEHPAFDFPSFNPEPDDEPTAFVHDIEYVGGIRVARAVVFWLGEITRDGWVCEHGEYAATPEDAAANCIQYCTIRASLEAQIEGKKI